MQRWSCMYNIGTYNFFLDINQNLENLFTFMCCCVLCTDYVNICIMHLL